MSFKRAEKRHPRSPVQDLLTKRSEVIAFADFLTTDERWLGMLRSSFKVIDERERLEAEAKEAARIAALPRWRRILIRVGVYR